MAIFCERRVASGNNLKIMGPTAMSSTAISHALVGPYGLHALAIAALVLFLTFLGIFNFTTFF
jgi:hypothetical protein